MGKELCRINVQGTAVTADALLPLLFDRDDDDESKWVVAFESLSVSGETWSDLQLNQLVGRLHTTNLHELDVSCSCAAAGALTGGGLVEALGGGHCVRKLGLRGHHRITAEAMERVATASSDKNMQINWEG
jgi:hypothetical protein